MREKYPDRRGPFSLALTAEAAFDPFIEGRDRAEKIRRIYALTIPDYPLGRSLSDEDFEAVGRSASNPAATSGPTMEDPAAHPPQSKLFRYQWGIKEPGFLLGQICADLDNDGRREIFYSSRGTKRTSLFSAADGKPRWTVTIPGEHQSACAYDLDGDGTYEIIYTTSGPGRIHVLDCKTGKILKQWEADDWKLGNSPVILDGDGDGVLDGYLGSRSKYLLRLNMRNLALIRKRSAWIQCGCHTSAMDVDGDGRWDLFAGCGDDDPYLELVVAGSGGLDVIETRGYGPNTEHFQRRRGYQRLNVVPWAYEDSYFIYRGTKDGVVNLTDNLVLGQKDRQYHRSGRFATELLSLPPNGSFDQIKYEGRTPKGTALAVNILNRSGQPIKTDVRSGSTLELNEPVRLEFVLSTADRSVTPTLDSYSLSFRRRLSGKRVGALRQVTVE